MNVALAYIFPNLLPKTYEPMARRFASKYVTHPPGVTDHELFVIVNGGQELACDPETLFLPLAPRFIYHDNSAKDLGAYFHAAGRIPCDLLVCIGSPVRPHLDGWLDMMVRAVEDNGPGLYGPWGSHQPRTHLRTTCFWIAPEILKAYPDTISNHNRYSFEHGRNSITLWCLSAGYNAMQVTRRGAFVAERFHHVNPDDSLMFDQICDVEGWKDA
jgi:hypothetical protein